MSVKQFLIGELTIEAHFRTSRKAKHLSIRINPDNRIDVVLPPGFNIARAESFLLQKSSWIKKHIKLQPASRFLYLGKKMQVIQDYNLFAKKHRIRTDGERLIITSPSGSLLKPETLFEVWLRSEAKKYIPYRTAQIAQKEDLRFNKISIKGQKTRWGSCSSGKNLSFNYRLMRHRIEIIDYVIIHELCHLKEMNHSVRFWQLVQKLCPGYQILKKEINMMGSAGDTNDE